MSMDHLVPDSVTIAARHAYLGRITMIDDYMAEIISKLKELKMDNT